MNKSFLLPLTLLLVVFASCTHNGYRIQGEVSPETGLNNATIKLVKDIAPTGTVDDMANWVYIDSVRIKDNQFSIKGKVDTPTVSYLVVTNERGETHLDALILENGTINIQIDSLGYMHSTGTPENDLLHTYNKAKIDEMYATMDYYKTVRKTYPQQKEWEKVVDSISNVMRDMRIEGFKADIDFVKKHINTVAGMHILKEVNPPLTATQKEEILALMNETNKQTPIAQRMIEEIATVEKTAIGKTFIDFSATTHYGKDVQLSDFVGKSDYLLLDFWSSWCQPCIASFPALKTFYNKNRGKKLEIVGISLDRERDEWLNAIQKNELNWVQLSDLKSENEAAKRYGITTIPTTILIDKEGKIVAKNSTIEQMQEIINRKK